MLDPADGFFYSGRNAFAAGDSRNARKLYKAAVKAGSVAAIHNLGVMLLHGQGCSVNYELARTYFEEAALHGIPESMNQLGYMYYYGKGCPTEFELARGWFLSSDMHGSHYYAQYHLGMMYALGQGAAQDWREAAKWLQMSADQGYVPAIYNLGVLFFNGDGVKQSYDKALSLYAAAAKMGHPEGENNYAVMCAEGLGTHKHTFEQVLQFWESAAAKNVSAAHFNLVNIHLENEVEHEVIKQEAPRSKYHKGLPSKLPRVSDDDLKELPAAPSTCSLASSLLPQSTVGRKTRPPALSLRSGQVQILAPPSPFFREYPGLASRVGTIPRSPTEPDLRDVSVNMVRSQSNLNIRKMATPEQSPVVKLKAYDTIASRRKVLVADLVKMPPTPS